MASYRNLPNSERSQFKTMRYTVGMTANRNSSTPHQQSDACFVGVALDMPPEYASPGDLEYLMSGPEPHEEPEYQRWQAAVARGETTRVFRWWQIGDRTESERQQVLEALDRFDHGRADRYAKTPVFDSGTVLPGTMKHLGRGVFGSRCPSCGGLFTDNGSSGISLYWHRVGEHKWSPPPLLHG